MRRELVKKWMTTEIVTVTPDTTLPKAYLLMVEHTIRHLLVVEDGRLLGIVSYGDIRDAGPARKASLDLWAVNYLVSQLAVTDIMTPNPITVHQDETVGRAAQLMLKNMISALPVMNTKGDVVGIITETDLFRLIVRDWLHGTEEEVVSYEHEG